MAHHGHFVESGLTVEDDQVAVADVPLHLVAALQVQIGRLGVEPQVDTVAILTDDVLGARVLRVASLDQLLHFLYVERGDDFGESHVLGDTSRHSYLIDPQIGIGGDDGTGREIDTLTHQITTNTTFLACKIRLNEIKYVT